jgi:hypothetical protein
MTNGIGGVDKQKIQKSRGIFFVLLIFKLLRIKVPEFTCEKENV